MMSKRSDSPEAGKQAGFTRSEIVSSTILGLDHGAARLGVALKPAGQDWALPIRIIDAHNETAAIDALHALIADYHPSAIVIGLPRHPDPMQAKAVRRF